MDSIFRRYVSPDFPPIERLARETSLLMVVGDEFLNPAFPMISKVVYIGGVGIAKTPDPLPEVCPFLFSLSINLSPLNSDKKIGTVTHVL